MHRSVVAATFNRECAQLRLNRFLHVHVAMCALVALLPLFTPDAAARAAPAWILQALLYCLSLSSLLLGLSAAQGDADEFSLLFTQPISYTAWLTGKVAAMTAVIGPASALLVVPAIVADGVTAPLLAVAGAAAGVCLTFAMLGLAMGLWVRDGVRALLVVLAAWFLLLFGIDLVLLALSGAPWVQQWASAWVVPLMVNPLSALRVTMIFSLSETAPASVGAGGLVTWWLSHGGLWLGVLLLAWMSATFALGRVAARRRLDG